jgi:predicted DNA-binding transcriptional regulator AlpA
VTLDHEIVGIAEIAKSLNWSGPTVCNWINRYPDFPKPIATLAMGRVFDMHEVRLWAVRKGKI